MREAGRERDEEKRERREDRRHELAAERALVLTRRRQGDSEKMIAFALRISAGTLRTRHGGRFYGLTEQEIVDRQARAGDERAREAGDRLEADRGRDR